VHGAFISEKELIRVVDFLSSQNVSEYRQDIAEFSDSCEGGEQEGEMEQKDSDEKFSDALNIVKEYNRCSTSFLQRHLCIGYNRAARIVEQMERAGMVGPVLNARGDREIFVNQNEANYK
jgi:S-DNA-T family DNA segregation ATPase FtsK/SpoIIIE